MFRLYLLVERVILQEYFWCVSKCLIQAKKVNFEPWFCHHTHGLYLAASNTISYSIFRISRSCWDLRHHEQLTSREAVSSLPRPRLNKANAKLHLNHVQQHSVIDRQIANRPLHTFSSKNTKAINTELSLKTSETGFCALSLWDIFVAGCSIFKLQCVVAEIHWIGNSEGLVWFNTSVQVKLYYLARTFYGSCA